MIWLSDDADQLREYLKRTDDRLIEYLKTKIPPMDARTMEETALQSKEFKGATGIIQEITLAAEKQPQKEPLETNVDVTVGLP